MFNVLLSHNLTICSFFDHSPILCGLGLSKLLVSISHLAQILYFLPWTLSLKLSGNLA